MVEVGFRLQQSNWGRQTFCHLACAAEVWPALVELHSWKELGWSLEQLFVQAFLMPLNQHLLFSASTPFNLSPINHSGLEVLLKLRQA